MFQRILHDQSFICCLISIFCGILIGIEREIKHKPAGVRTCALVCLGATVFTLLSQSFIGTTGSDVTRIASNIVQGIGFLGAGSILTYKNKVIGLTTASVIWAVAAVGMAIGFHKIVFAIQVTVLTMIVLLVVGTLEVKLVKKRAKRA
jgi:putative Mg2+ transporter-C (MgtC) family protein